MSAITRCPPYSQSAIDRFDCISDTVGVKKSCIFSKFTGKQLFKSLYVGVLFLIKLIPSDLYFGLLFDKLFQAATLKWKGSNTGSSLWVLRNFLDFFQGTRRQIILVYLELLSLLSKQLQYFSYYIAAVVLAQPYENNNHLTC